MRIWKGIEMKENLKEIVEYLEKVRSDLIKNVPDNIVIKDEKVNKGNSWSPGEILEHIYKTEIYITELLKRQMERAIKRELRSAADNTSFLHSLDQFEIERIKEKFIAPEQTIPDRSADPENILQKMDKSRAELIQLLHTFSEYDMEGMEFPHPAYGRMNMLQWVIFIGKHELRHLNQMKQIIKFS